MAMRTLRTSARSLKARPTLPTASIRFASYQANQPFFNDYSYPAAAKHWMATYPQQEEADDAYPAEYVYLDELEERIQGFHEQYPNSPEFDRAYNEYGWQNYETPIEAYGTLGGKREAALFGRGQKVSPEWYFNPDFTSSTRWGLNPSQMFEGDQKELWTGQLSDKLQLPPEEPSIMKFWNPYQLFATGFVLFCSKEWFLIAHDLNHAVCTWLAISMTIAATVDWWYYYYALRQQEEYDKNFFPLNERVKNLYEMLENMELNGSTVEMIKSFDVYGKSLSQASVDKKLVVMKSEAAREAYEKMDAMYKKEQADKKLHERSWTAKAYDDTMTYFSEAKNTKPYMQTALKQLGTGENASLVAGAQHGKTTTSTFADKYKAVYETTKKAWFDDQRAKKTLPWVMADEKERKAAAHAPKVKEDMLNKHIADLRSMYHNFA